MPHRAPSLAQSLLADLTSRLAREGSAAVVSQILAVPDPSQRRQLFGAVQRHFGNRSSPSRDLDALLVIGRAAIDEAMRQSAAETDPASAATLKDAANASAYSLSADLAECWEGDTAPRARRHFEAGLAAARDCAIWRGELRRNMSSRSMAWWACGVHELSLGRNSHSVSSFERSLECAIEASPYRLAEIEPRADFGVLLASGYLGLAERSGLFEAVCKAFLTAAEGPEGEVSASAAFGLSQLRWYASRIDHPDRPPELRR